MYADYSSDAATGFGFDVNVNWGGSITEQPDGIAYLIDAGGNEHHFTDPDEDGRYTSPSGGNNALVKNGDGTWTETSPHGRKYHYDSNGRLLAKSNLGGSRWTATYDGGGKRQARPRDRSLQPAHDLRL